MEQDSGAPHYSANDIAAYVDGTLPRGQRLEMSSHIARCEACRREVGDVRQALGMGGGAIRWSRRTWIPAAAAAAAAVLFIVLGREPAGVELVHRDSATVMETAPRPLAPLARAGVRALVWSSVPRVELYRARVFDVEGTVLLEREVADTVLVLPPDLRLDAERRYFWQVAAQTGVERWAESELTQLSLHEGSEP